MSKSLIQVVSDKFKRRLGKQFRICINLEKDKLKIYYRDDSKRKSAFKWSLFILEVYFEADSLKIVDMRNDEAKFFAWADPSTKISTITDWISERVKVVPTTKREKINNFTIEFGVDIVKKDANGKKEENLLKLFEKTWGKGKK
jgi:hypothetical protein